MEPFRLSGSIIGNTSKHTILALKWKILKLSHSAKIGPVALSFLVVAKWGAKIFAGSESFVNRFAAN